MHKLLPHLYETIARESMFGIVVFESTGECLYSNKMADQMLGASEHLLQDLIPSASRHHIKAFSKDLMKHDGFYQDILVAKKSDQSTFIANIGVRFIEVDGHTAHLLMLQDVTLQKKLQREIMAKQTEIKAAFEELLNQNRKLKELDLAKDRFIALTTHELRTPLSAMVASSEILKLGIYDNEEQMREFIDMIYDQGLHLQDLVNDILDFAKIQAGKMEFFIEKHDPAVLSETLIKSFADMAHSNQVTLHFHPPAEKMECYYDELRLRQVLSNMINNAIKYNKPGGRVDLEFANEAGLIKILVRDTGKGIAKDQFDKVFNEFETVGQVAAHHKGTGLGMPISRRLTEAMGGTVALDSVPGIGSTFWVELPTEKVLDEEVYRPRPEKLTTFAA